MNSETQHFIESQRLSEAALSDSDRLRLSAETFFQDVCHVIYSANDPADRPFLIRLLHAEMSRRRTDTEHDGERLVLCGLLLALQRDVSDVLLLWQIKQLDFDMGCLFDVQLLVFAGVEKTMASLNAQETEEASQVAAWIEQCRAAGDFDEMAEYVAERLSYFGLV